MSTYHTCIEQYLDKYFTFDKRVATAHAGNAETSDDGGFFLRGRGAVLRRHLGILSLLGLLGVTSFNTFV